MTHFRVATGAPEMPSLLLFAVRQAVRTLFTDSEASLKQALRFARLEEVLAGYVAGSVCRRANAATSSSAHGQLLGKRRRT